LFFASIFQTESHGIKYIKYKDLEIISNKIYSFSSAIFCRSRQLLPIARSDAAGIGGMKPSIAELSRAILTPLIEKVAFIVSPSVNSAEPCRTIVFSLSRDFTGIP
jgi:hypothetical protein